VPGIADGIADGGGTLQWSVTGARNEVPGTPDDPGRAPRTADAHCRGPDRYRSAPRPGCGREPRS